MKALALIISCVLGAALPSLAQDKVFELNLVSKLINNGERKPAYNVTIAFNKFKGNPTDAKFLYTKNLPKEVVLGLLPTFEANLGSDVKAAPNNITSSLLGTFVKGFSAGKTLFLDVAPVLVTDKDFSTGLLYASISPGGLKYWNHESADSVRYNTTLLGRVGLQSGNRFVKGAETQAIEGGFSRLTPNLYLEHNIQRFDKQSNLRNILNVKVDAKYYCIYGDGLLGETKNYPSITGALAYTLPVFKQAEYGEIRLTVKYFYGYEEPLYRELSTVTYGLGYFVKL